MAKPTADSISDLEKSDELSGGTLKLDPHGLPLVPQPSDFKDDPLVSDYLIYTDPTTFPYQIVLIASRTGRDG